MQSDLAYAYPMRTTETRQWGWTRSGQLWCTRCRGTGRVPCQHTDIDTTGWCRTCDQPADEPQPMTTCRTCEE
jgi:hypothetical protein